MSFAWRLGVPAPMSKSTVPPDSEDPLAQYEREADSPRRSAPASPPPLHDPAIRRQLPPPPRAAVSWQIGADALAPIEREMLRKAQARRRTWLLIGFAALALIQVPFVVMWALQTSASSANVTTLDPETVTLTLQPAEAPDAPAGAKPALSTMEIVTEPVKAAISVDGRQRGPSPVNVTDLTAGTHTVVARFSRGTVQRQIRLGPGAVALLVITMPRGTMAGWVTPDVPASFQILENGRLIGITDVDRLMLPVGRHSLEFVSEELGFRTTQTVTVNPGATTTVRLALPWAPLSINAQPWAEIWIGGERIGQTPIGNASRPIGRHEVIFRHPSLGERKASVLVTLKEPARIAVDLRASK